MKWFFVTVVLYFVIVMGTAHYAFSQRSQTFTMTSSSSPCATIAVAVDRTSTVVIDVAGTFSMTIQPSVSLNGGTAHNTQVTPSTSQTPQSTITSAGGYQATQVAGWDLFQVCVSSYVSGTATVTLSISTGIAAGVGGGGGGGSGTVTSVSVVTANGVSGTVANPTTTPAITLALGAITPSSVTCGVLNTTSCVFTGYGSTSGSGTITWPAVAGTATNSINFSNYIQAPGLVQSNLTTSNAIVKNSSVGLLEESSLVDSGGVTIGSPTGGAEGNGTLNATGLYVNGTAVSGGGNVSTSGSPASGYFAQWASGTTIANGVCDYGVTTASTVTCTGSGGIVAGGPLISGTSGGLGGTWKGPEGTPPSGVASSDLMYADSTAHRVKAINNNGTATTYALFTDNLSVFAAGALSNGSTATTQTYGDNTTKIATDAFVAAAVTGSNPATAVLVATTANLTGTYVQVGGGIGDTFTLTATGATTIDGVALTATGQPVLLKNQSTASQNGIYTVTVVGTTGVSTVFTRASDYDTPADVNNTGPIFVQSGTANAITSWLLTSQVTSIGSSGSSLTYSQSSSNPSNLVLALSPGVGVAHFAGSTQTVTSSAVALGDMATGTANSLVGYNGSGTPAVVTIGSGLSLSSGVLTASGGGSGGNVIYCSGSASATAATCAGVPSGATTYTAMTGYFIAGATSTGAPLTVNVNSLGAKNVYLNGSATSATNAVVSGNIYPFYYDGTEIQLTAPGVAPAPSYSLIGAVSGAGTAGLANSSTQYNVINYIYIPPVTFSNIYLDVSTDDATHLYSVGLYTPAGTAICVSTAADVTATGLFAFPCQSTTTWSGGMLLLVGCGAATTVQINVGYGSPAIPYSSSQFGTASGGQCSTTSITPPTAGQSVGISLAGGLLK